VNPVHVDESNRPHQRPDRDAPSCEEIDIRTADGWSLRADVREPRPVPVGTAVLAHAVMSRRSSFDRPENGGLGRFLVDRGWRVVSFDFRAHGDSRPRADEGAAYSYDDLVRSDLPTVHAFARSCGRRGEPVVLVGHSLGGHAALAAQGCQLVDFDAIVAIATNVWLRELEPSGAVWVAKRAALRAAVEVTRRLGRFPARALRLGSDDEARGYVEDVARFARTGAWSSADGQADYLASLGRCRVPLLPIVSDGDRIECTPESGARFAAHLGARCEVVRVGRRDDGGRAPGHMGLVTSGGVSSVWARAEAWMRRAAVGAP
jgi:predicted alpha/beta hydrolase